VTMLLYMFGNRFKIDLSSSHPLLSLSMSLCCRVYTTLSMPPLKLMAVMFPAPSSFANFTLTTCGTVLLPTLC